MRSRDQIDTITAHMASVLPHQDTHIFGCRVLSGSNGKPSVLSCFRAKISLSPSYNFPCLTRILPNMAARGAEAALTLASATACCCPTQTAEPGCNIHPSLSEYIALLLRVRGPAIF